MISKPCLVCKGPITQRKGVGVKAWSRQIYCSKACLDRRATVRPKQTKPCEKCGTVITRKTEANVHWDKKRFCSRECWKTRTFGKKPETSQVGFRLRDKEIDLLAKYALRQDMSLSNLLRIGVRTYFKKLLEKEGM